MASASATAPAPASVCRMALLQILVGSDKAANLKIAEDAIADAARHEAKVVVLPECFNRCVRATGAVRSCVKMASGDAGLHSCR
jgi:hypothetical protein